MELYSFLPLKNQLNDCVSQMSIHRFGVLQFLTFQQLLQRIFPQYPQRPKRCPTLIGLKGSSVGSSVHSRTIWIWFNLSHLTIRQTSAFKRNSICETSPYTEPQEWLQNNCWDYSKWLLWCHRFFFLDTIFSSSCHLVNHTNLRKFCISRRYFTLNLGIRVDYVI